MNVTLTQSLNKWLKTFEMSVNEECVKRSAQDLSDGVFIAHVLNHISPAFFTTEWLSNIKKSDSNENEVIDDDFRVNNLEEITEKVIEFYREIMGKEIEDNMKPDVKAIVCDLNNSSEQLGLLLRLIFGCAVNCDAKDYFIQNIVDINDEEVINCLKNSITQESELELESESIERINTNNNLSEMSEKDKFINCSNNCINDCNNDCNNDNNVIINTNLSNSCSDINAKESFAQLSNNDLEIKLNQMSAENCKLLNDKEKLEKLVERMNKTGVGFVDSNSTSNGINEELLIRYQKKIETLQNDVYKLEEMKENYTTNIELLQEEVNKLRANNIQSLLINRESVAGVCDHDLLYKLIISQLLYDGHRNLALTLSSVEKLKQVCPPSDRLHNLVAIALKAEGDSPSLSDDSIHPMNLIDLDFEADRNSASSRASLYETSVNREYLRGRSFSPDNEMISNSGNMSHRMSDMGRMISKTSPMTDSMQNMNQIHSNDSIGSCSTPELNISTYGQSMNNGLRSITPNSRETEMMGPSGIIGNASQQLDFNDLMTQINLAQLAYFNTDPTSVASSSANTPSPTPMNPSVPLENGGLVLNEAALKNLSQLAKMSANEVQNGLMPPSSTSPASIASTLGRCSTNSTTKPNVMQIRIKFGQLGGQKGQFSSPHGFCLGVDEEIVIADTNNHRICIFDKSGDFKHSFGVPGKDEAQLWYPRKVAIIRTTGNHSVTPAPRYVICDRGAERSRMQIFTRSGHFVRKIAIRYIDIVAGLAITPNGHIVAVDSVSPTVFVIAESGDLLRWFDCSEYMREPSDIAINNHEYYICDFKGHCVVVFNDEGQYMRKIGCEGLTSFPNGIDISDAGDILVGDSHGNRFHVVVFDRNGTLISEFECPYVKVSRCCGLKITSEGYVVTLAKNNHHVLILNTLYIM